ncbi:MAG: hypothetical protein JNL18_10390 [Planctomycetaceae bacterium]|nr:hypothetical protein [Planctomycetaceae bacterium]
MIHATSLIASWLKQHGAAERSFGRALQRYFAEQADRTAETIRENFPGALPFPSQMPLIFDANAEHEKLRPIVRRNLAGLLIVGAKAEAQAVQRRLEGKAYGDDFADVDLPPETLAGLRRALDELEGQDYWKKIQSETEANLTSIIEQAIIDKADNYQLGMRIREHLGGMPANKRAQKIARTETTGAMNAGHFAYMDSLIEEGIVTGKEWNAIGDSDCRDSHAALSGKVVPAREMFIVGSSPAPHPGHWSLPAKERVNCRCVVLSVFSGTAFDVGIPDGEDVDVNGAAAAYGNV